MDLSGQSWLPRQGGASGKESASNAGDIRDECSIPGDSLPGESSFSRKIPWRRKWQPTPVFLPGDSHGQRTLAGYSPWGRKESDMTEAT